MEINGKKYRAVVCDFDGTLIGRDLLISDQVKQAIYLLRESNILFIIASGRCFNGLIKKACEELGLIAPQITRGGSEIVDPTKNKVIHTELIPNSEIARLITVLNKLNISYAVEKGEYIYTKGGESISGFGDILFKKLDDLELTDIPKVLIFPFKNSDKEKEFEEILNQQFDSLHITKSYSPVGKSWDITSAMANKQEAILKVARLLDISTNEIIGIGDGYNDFPLLMACGYKVAMKNAHQELKEVADRVIPSYEEDGVAIFLNELLNK